MATGGCRPAARIGRILVSAMLLAAAPVASAGTATLPPPAPLAIVEDLQPVRLAGEGAYRYFGLLIYDARLWVGPQGYRDSDPGAAPFVLELRYARDLQGSRIAEASAGQMEKIGAGSAEQRKAWLEIMRGVFPDVREHDRIAGRYIPGQGVRFYLNGAPLAGRQNAAADAAMDDKFAQAFFAIWLSPRTTAPALRKALLRDAAPKP